MDTYISLLRGINVGGNNKILMKDLKELYVNLNLKEVVTYIQSGNVVFKSNQTKKTLKKHIEKGIFDSFNLKIDVFILTPKNLQKSLNKCTFLTDSKYDTSKIYFSFLDSTPKNYTEILEPFNKENAHFYNHSNTLYLYYPNGAGKTKLTNNLIEKKLQLRATSRNLKTVTKLLEISSSFEKKTQNKNKLIIKDENKESHIINTSKLIKLISIGKGITEIHTTNSVIVSNKSIGKIQEKLDPTVFIRINWGIAINSNHILKIDFKNNTVYLKDDSEETISFRRKKDLKNFFS